MSPLSLLHCCSTNWKSYTSWLPLVLRVSQKIVSLDLGNWKRSLLVSSSLHREVWCHRTSSWLKGTLRAQWVIFQTYFVLDLGCRTCVFVALQSGEKDMGSLPCYLEIKVSGQPEMLSVLQVLMLKSFNCKITYSRIIKLRNEFCNSLERMWWLQSGCVAFRNPRQIPDLYMSSN